MFVETRNNNSVLSGKKINSARKCKTLSFHSHWFASTSAVFFLHRHRARVHRVAVSPFISSRPVSESLRSSRLGNSRNRLNHVTQYEFRHVPASDSQPNCLRASKDAEIGRVQTTAFLQLPTLLHVNPLLLLLRRWFSSN